MHMHCTIARKVSLYKTGKQVFFFLSIYLKKESKFFNKLNLLYSDCDKKFEFSKRQKVRMKEKVSIFTIYIYLCYFLSRTENIMFPVDL